MEMEREKEEGGGEKRGRRFERGRSFALWSLGGGRGESGSGRWWESLLSASQEGLGGTGFWLSTAK